MRIKLNSVLVADQERALRFYTELLGFVKKVDLPVGKFRWLTVVSADEPEGTQLVLEPNVNPAAATYQRALFDAGIPLASFEVDDVAAEFDRLEAAGVDFRVEPSPAGDTTVAMFDDGCGNLIQIYQGG